MATQVSVTWGEQTISPVSYNTFKIGPFSMTTEVREEETDEQAMERVYAALESFARSTYAKKLESFKEAYRAATSATKGGR
jgi:hypothetical protein